ncbi:extracellular matrix organizing protein FRAS1-like isoform X2 [Mya arenaria]|nr:extracellular matrix organizing protein FRAS1-like isoform X2 [Mya arenaria]XP_052791093.1 extracellular matrix organizing protein FRAS1-like isoform X2 [Mya arenaria]
MTNLSSCTYQQQTIPHNTEWNAELCVQCLCDNGAVECGRVACPEAKCHSGEITHTPPGQCCPQCIPAGRSCTYEGEHHRDGTTWTPLPCTKCVCTDGQHQCYPVQCPPVVCAETETLETLPGTCCPSCHGFNSTCKEGSGEYKTGEQWHRDPCTLCVCIGGTVVCTLKECMDLIICNHNEKKVTRPGDCCPECVPTHGACDSLDPPRYSGDLWNTSSCEYCMCDKGKVLCHKASCENLVCFKEEVLIHHPGSCCPQCVIPPSCELAGQTHKDGSWWKADDCTLCECHDGVTRCYQEHCPDCPSGHRRNSLLGECCGTCEKITCNPQCTDCEIGAPDNCTSCTNTQLFVQDGRCLHTCRMGFYPSPHGTCLPCDETCYTCIEGSQFHCEMCQPGLMWKHGECVTQCGLGYYLQNGKCLECAPSCKSCSGPGSDQCVSCSNHAQVVFHGECRDHCPDNFYIRLGKCIACNPTCKTCTPDGSSCASCWQGGHLHQGQCVTRCSSGLYVNRDGSCSECHPSCETCNGGSNKNCTSCFPGNKISKKGRCRSECDKGQYLAIDNICKDCESGCEECHAAWGGVGSVCSGCEQREDVPLGSICMEDCPQGHYQEFKACKACGDHCLSCNSPTSCTRCTKNMLVSQGQCVTKCGQGQYEEGATMSCKDCSSHCLHCYSGEECSVCDSTTFLQGRACVSRCGSGFIPDTKTRECRRNLGPPILKVLNHIEVPDGEIATVDFGLFFVSDPDTPTEDLIVTIVTLPSNGDLVMATEGHDLEIKAGENMTVGEIMEGRLRFRHHAGHSDKGMCKLQVSDNKLTSPYSDLYFQGVMTSAITIATRSLLLATQGDITVIRSSVLDLHTLADPENVNITVLQGPKEGTLVNSLRGLLVRVFSLANLRSGVIGYSHKGHSGSDSVLLQGTDGFHVITFLLNIQIREKESIHPVLMHNRVGHVTLGEKLQISNDLLLATVLDEAHTEEVVYTLTPTINNPQEGEVLMVVPIPPSGVGNGWDDIGEGYMAARLTRFLQRDIDEGRIWYKNRGTAAFTDFIRFEVADTGSSTDVLSDQAFKITVREKAVPGPMTHPTLASGIHLAIKVLENELVPITPASLSFMDHDTSPAGIYYEVTRPLGLRDGSLEHVERPSRNVHIFTQEDVNNNRIIYRPPAAELGYKEKEVFFFFTVSDGNEGEALIEHKFSITLVPVNNQPPRLTSLPPTLHLAQGGSLPIGQAVVSVVDDDTPLDNLTITLTRAPHSGKLEKMDGKNWLTLKEGDTFSYRELTDNVFQYRHDGSGTLYDTMQVVVSDGEHKTATSVDVRVLRMDQSAPHLLPSASCRLVVKEGTAQPITRDVLAFADSDDLDLNLNILLTKATRQGKLLLGNMQAKAGNTFTQADINNGKLSFLADSEIGQSHITEILIFNVSDISGNILPSQTLTVLIEPDNNLPPKVEVTKKLKVKEGGKASLTSDLITVTDLDTPLSDLVVVIATKPEHGAIRNIAPAEGSDVIQDRMVTKFPAEDLQNGYILYSQSDHVGCEPVSDSVVFYVEDGKNRSPPSRLNISIQGVNDEKPDIVVEQVFVQEGQRVVITNNSVFITDLDTAPSNITLTVAAPPEHGILRIKNATRQLFEEATLLRKGSNFSYQEILDGLLMYGHDGSQVAVDTFSLLVTDGNHTSHTRVPVIMGLINDESPRVVVNRGLRVYAGTNSKITWEELHCTDMDSDAMQLTYTVTKEPRFGALYLGSASHAQMVSSKGPVSSFTQEGVFEGDLEYHHSQGETTGTTMFTFIVSDPEGNNLIDQEFFITVLDDRSPPELVKIVEPVCEEGSQVTFTLNNLQFRDMDSPEEALLYKLVEAPKLGHLELTTSPGDAIVEFHQSDLVSKSVKYVHTSLSEDQLDSFIFSVSDGANSVTQPFTVRISPVDDSIPFVTNNGLKVQAGVRKVFTEFDLKAEDLDTTEDLLTFKISQHPQHGNIERLVDSDWQVASSFSMSEIYEGHVSYMHDGRKAMEDVVRLTATDGTNEQFIVSNNGEFSLPQTESFDFHIEIQAKDDGSPVLEANLGLQFLEDQGPLTGNIITSHELRAVDEDTPATRLEFVVRKAPDLGRLELTTHPGVDVASFTQEDIDNSLIRYVLTKPGQAYEDSFTFDLYDSRPNRVPGNIFHITWSVVEFEQPLMNVTETAGVVLVPIVRKGYLKQYSMVTCHTQYGTATSSEQGSRPGQQDFVPYMTQVKFDEWQTKKACAIIINDDSIFEGRETFYVELIQPSFTLLGSSMKISVTIEDLEDEPVLQFQNAEYHVKEGDSYLSANILRTGDISSTVSTICYTTSLSARGSPLDRLDSGSDYISRGNSNSFRVLFPSGVTVATCDVKIIDDSVAEASEQFDLQLTLPSYGARLGARAHATVVIDGPNDESSIHFSQASYNFSEDAGTVSVELVRDGNDLSHTSTVWCATRLANPPSAAAGHDYIPSTSQITFGPGQRSQTCQLTLLDDTLDPRVEGVETFSVFLSSAVSSNLVQPYHATVSIDDTWQDVPSMSFEESSYMVDESSGHVSVQIVRTGDSSLESSVVCYTQQDFALVGVDYVDRALSEEARIVFLSGEKVKNCTVEIVNDDIFESNETFHMQLAQPLGSDQYQAYVGEMNSTTVTITNTDDVPKIQFERSAYSIPEPSVKDQITTVMLRVMRFGDVTRTASVRCSTRDGSAAAGTDFNPKSQFLVFAEGVKNLNFTVDVLYNSDIEWHETFSIVLGPDQPAGAELGLVSTATITILDNDVSGSMVLPAPPVVVSLLQYDSVETGMRVEPTPGYPLVCVTPCDPHYPTYTTTQPLCEQGGMNQSAMFYRWEVAVPDLTGARPPFIEISYNTVFTSVNHITLDSIYFRPSFQVRCVVQPLDTKGNPGIPLKSNPVLIGRDNGICKSSRYSGLPFSYEAQSFHATLDYVGTEDKSHPNTIHVKVKVPHQDGMLPLISTFPISNLKYVLSEPIYRQQHLCSNIIIPEERSILLQSGFLGNSSIQPKHLAAGYDFPYQFDPELRDAKTLMFYKYLNMKECLWQFEAWYHMTDLVDLCGGRAMSDFQVRGRGQTYLTVRVPLYVSYLYAVAPIGWGSLEHMTELEFSFYYDTVLWRSGLETRGQLGGRLQVMRVVIGDDRRLVVDIKTQAKFRGVYVLSHPTLPGYTSRFVSKETDIKFDLDLVWGQNTFDGPQQLWRATSQFSFKDYSGKYSVELIPCTVSGTQSYTIHSPMPCTAQQPLEFEVPIAFQQSNRPVPLEYTLNTHFQITNKEQEFFANPFSRQNVAQSGDNDVAFAKGDQLYGRVLWSPEQDLQAAFSLALERVYICAGRDGHIPTYDPTGTVYNSGPQYGCIRPGPDLKYRFLVLDRSAPKFTSKQFEGVRFDAMFASESPQYASLVSVPGMDGFVLRVDPLYKVMSGFQWYLQVIYSIGPTDSIFRRKRSALLSLDKNKRSAADSANMKYDWLESNTSKNGTNIKVLNLNNTQVQEVIAKTDSEGGINLLTILLPIICAVIILLIISCVIIIIIRKKRRKRHQRHVPVHRRNNLEPCPRNTVIYKGKPNNPITVRCSSSLELKQSVVYKGDHGKSAVRIKDTNIQKDKNISKNNGTEV